MNADIHWFVERRTVNDTWEPCLPAVFDEFGDASRSPRPCLVEADYSLFGRLAGVCSDDEPYFAVRGLPDDISPELKAHYLRPEVEFHTPSWLTLTELLEATDLGKITTRTLWVFDRVPTDIALPLNQAPPGYRGRADDVRNFTNLRLKAPEAGADPFWVHVDTDPHDEDYRPIQVQELTTLPSSWMTTVALMAAWSQGDGNTVRGVFWFED